MGLFEHEVEVYTGENGFGGMLSSRAKAELETDACSPETFDEVKVLIDARALLATPPSDETLALAKQLTDLNQHPIS